MCYWRWAIAATYDAEDDVVIACADPANVVGCREGRTSSLITGPDLRGVGVRGECRRWGMRWWLRREGGRL